MHFPKIDPIVETTVVHILLFLLSIAIFAGIVCLYLYIHHRRQTTNAAIRRMHRSWMRKRNELDIWILLNRHQSPDCMEAQRFIQAELSALEYLSINKPLNLEEEKRRKWLVSIMDVDKVPEFPN